ncbi:MAG: DUF4292 domain-containing protein [Bacteroidales bacterium]|nr:DUF4292 domain-containing protein [Bacteroidales bacterium]
MKKLFWLLTVVVLLASACNRSRKGTECPVEVVEDTVQAVVDTVPVPVEPSVPKAYAPSVRQWLSVRASGRMEVPGAGGLELNLFAVLAKDSVVYLHISKFGIELGRALCRPEKVVVLIHPESGYWAGSYALLRKKTGLPLDFEMVQDLLLLTPHNARVEIDSGGFLRKVQWTSAEGGGTVTAQYSDYAHIGGEGAELLYPRSISVSLPSLGSARLTVKSAKPDVPGPVSLKIPEKYKLLKF